MNTFLYLIYMKIWYLLSCCISRTVWPFPLVRATGRPIPLQCSKISRFVSRSLGYVLSKMQGLITLILFAPENEEPICMSSGARAISVFKCENQSPFSGANSIKVICIAFSLKRNGVIGWRIAKSCYIGRVWEGLWPWPAGRVTRYCG